jgi:para-nitrobenzyl esterase
MFRAGVTRTADAVALHAPTFVYLFTHRSPALGGWLGCCHCLELPFVFGAEHVPDVTTWTGSGPAVGDLTWGPAAVAGVRTHRRASRPRP